MKELRKLPLWLTVVVLFAALSLVGRWTAPKPDKDLLQKYETERKFHLLRIEDLNGKLADRDKVGFIIREKMKEDSLIFSEQLQANNKAYLRLKKKYNEINLHRANAHTLDSLVSRLYPD